MHGPDWRRLLTFGVATLGGVAVFFSCVTARSAIAKPDKQVAVVCLDPGYYREQAAHFRQLAAAVAGDGFINQMMELAAAYEAKAAELEAQQGERVTIERRRPLETVRDKVWRQEVEVTDGSPRCNVR